MLCYCKRFPFDCKNPIGYLIATVLQLIAMLYQARYMACCLAVTFGTFLFTTVMMNDITGDIKAINDDIKSRKSECYISKKMCALMELHSDAKQLSAIAKY